ncbi:diaminopimelate epimerase [Cardiobacterium valvarum]|uniref:Diaminopimelate epimerase n=1 Tax=Cardiobacterium valvarum TaxID=194702 RepID=A0A381E360_9GAMM|nr:diaminopimelate epimerase [Cardiobacterium valvarum]SUX20579.1 Diaminopimelate epimerase [Cardiobacterium valvarum]
MSIRTFSKMHGLGNDFIVLNALHETFDWPREKILALADRHSGIGFDQLLIIEAAPDAAHDFAYRIYNADGGEVEHCGNGARCFGKYLHDHGLHPLDRPVRVAVKRGSITIARDGGDNYRVDMGVPDFTPFTAAQSDCLYQPVNVAGVNLQLGIVSMGNPHAVCVVDDVTTAPVAAVGAALQTHPLFPAAVNVGFMQIDDRRHIRLRVYERGAGETQACGTGACAAVAVGIKRGLLDCDVTVRLTRGELRITWPDDNAQLIMSGPAATVYHGELA